ncbi:N-acetylneuraminate epimerase [BD1-7 clade bacterium]|uniref:N-acetylneuraminate epimerase n=1 Tax=BD1-7 clade bacterium TaxID=2029982 RepID=A0A5S9N0X1_9GAMM|nr:N-acetylneuraminate epimerase [BD1-7 clade bacterium]
MKKPLILAAGLTLFIAACDNDDDKSSTPETTSTAFTALVGAKDTLIHMRDAKRNDELYRSNEHNCDIANYASCENGQLSLLSGAREIIHDTAAQANKEAHYILKSGKNRIQASLNQLPASRGHQMLEHDGKLMHIGGLNDKGYSATVMMSDDIGRSWKQIEPAITSMPAVADHQVVSQDRTLLLSGGRDANGAKADMLRSDDNGKSWTPIQPATPITPRYAHQMLLHKGMLYMSGGTDGNQVHSDLLKSSDMGETWQNVNPSPHFGARHGHQMLSYDGKLWMTGGNDGNSVNDEIWMSEDDGKKWSKLTPAQPIHQRMEHKMVVHQGKMLLLGGNDGHDNWRSDVMSSKDGIAWSTEIPNWKAIKDKARHARSRAEHQAASHKDNLLLSGGIHKSGQVLADVWAKAPEQTELGLASPAPEPFDSRKKHHMVNHQGKIIAMGGDDGESLRADMHVSDDEGMSWEMVKPKVVNASDIENPTSMDSDGNMTPRSDLQMVSMGSKLFVIGGAETADKNHSEVMMSEDDGKTLSILPFIRVGTVFPQDLAKTGHQAVVHADKIMVIGGKTDETPVSTTADVITSADGQTWQKETANIPATYDHQVVKCHDQLYLIGGRGSDGELRTSNVVMRSDDGMSWAPMATSTMEPIADHKAICADDNLYVLGGSVPAPALKASASEAAAHTDSEMLAAQIQLLGADDSDWRQIDGSPMLKDLQAVEAATSIVQAGGAGLAAVAAIAATYDKDMTNKRAMLFGGFCSRLPGASFAFKELNGCCADRICEK